MTTIALLAAKGSPGVSTLASAMVLARGHSGAVLIEADQHGGDLALLHGVSQSPGLAELAARARRTNSGEDLLAPYIRALAGGAVPTVPAPVDGQAVRAALNMLADHPGLLEAAGADRTLVFDLGRAEPDSPGWMWLTTCDRVLLVARTDLTGLAHAKNLAERLRECEARAALALIDTGPYPTAEAQDVLGLPLTAVLPFHPKQARTLTDPNTMRSAARGRLATRAGQILDAARERRKVPVS